MSPWCMSLFELTCGNVLYITVTLFTAGNQTSFLFLTFPHQLLLDPVTFQLKKLKSTNSTNNMPKMFEEELFEKQVQ